MTRKSPALIDRLAFERLLADLASRFADVAPEAVVAEIESALARLVDFFGYDRCTYAEFLADGTLNVVASAATRGVPPHELGPFDSTRAWFLGELRAGRAVILPALPKGLPPHARAEARFVARSRLRSHLSIPLRRQGRTTGVISFAGVRRARAWPKDVVVRLTIIGEVFASAVARARSEDEARHLRARLWHADRVARISALTAAIAHEINQPLTAILSNAQAGLAYLGRDDAPPGEMRAILEAVVSADKRAAETIRTMRAFLRHDDSRSERIDLAAAVREVLQLLATELGRKSVRVELQLEPGCYARADRTQIEQVALNLVLNGAAAMETFPEQERELRVSVARTDDGRVAVEVGDRGIGIAAGDIDKVFEPFWTTRKEGLGLGLAICRSIVEAHGGAIRVTPNAGRGVTFRFELAYEAGAVEPQALPAHEAPAGDAAPLAAAAWPVVCVIDDDAAMRESLQRLLAAEGWAVACYASAAEFLERQAFAAVGCVVLDNQMPGMSGLELHQNMAERGPAPPVVFLTGVDNLAAGVRAMKLGAADFLVKPVEDGVLREAVRKALARHAAERERARERELALARLGRLTAREREVMAHVLRGRLNKQIAADLDVAIQTVKQHRSRIMEKMQVRSVAELVRACAAGNATA
jgi:FixJ family two-component response regulator/signal transduction histidine kinase